MHGRKKLQWCCVSQYWIFGLKATQIWYFSMYLKYTQLHNSILVLMVFRFEVLWFESQWGPIACELLTVFKQQQWLHFQWMFIFATFGSFKFLQLCYQWRFFTCLIKCRHQRTNFAESKDKWPRFKFEIKYRPSESIQINNLNRGKTLTGIHLKKSLF